MTNQATNSKSFIIHIEKTNKEICKLLKVTMPTLLSALKIVRIELKGSGNRMSKSIIII